MANAIEVPPLRELPSVVVHPGPPDLEEPWPIDLASVATAEDLPSRLLLGRRDDASFVRTGDGWRCEYPGPRGMGIDMRCASGQCVLEQYWAGVHLESTWPAGEGWTGLLRALGPLPPPEAWQYELARGLEKAGRFEWIGDTWSGEIQAPCLFLPDGHPVCVLFHVRPERLADLWDLHQRAIEGSQPLHLSGRTLLRRFELRRPLELGAGPGHELFELDSECAALLERILGLPQLPTGTVSLQREETTGWALVRQGGGYLHVCETWIRDLLPLCEALVEAGFVPTREDVRPEARPAIDLLTRAVVCPAFRLLAPLELWSTDAKLKLTHAPLGHELWGRGEPDDAEAARPEPHPSYAGGD